MNPTTCRVAIIVSLALVTAACSGDSDSSGADAAEDPAVAPTEFAGTIDLDVESPGRCEVVGEICALPFPSDALTVEDPGSETGRRVSLDPLSMPANVEGVHIDVSRQNRNDGFSPGSAALVHLPGLDPADSNLPPVTDLARSLDDDSGSVVIDATAGERWPHWAELDANAPTDRRRGLFLRPGVNYPDGHRIVIGLRNLVDADGAPIEPTDAFRAYRDRLETDVPEVESRRPAMEQVFDDLEAAGVARDELTIAWDFTVISTESLTGPLLHMRDDAFDQLGDAAPAFTVDEVTEDVDNDRRVITGTFEIPLYLADDGAPGTSLNLIVDPDLPEPNGIWTAPFSCQITGATSADDPGAGVVYGYGLLGTHRQTTSAGPTLLAENHNYVVCGTDLIGMAEEDVPNAITTLQDVSNFPTLADRLLQGHLNHLFLGRLLKHADGLAADPAFQTEDGGRLVDTDELYYYGISQGGIMGPVSTAVSLDWDKGVFGVAGVNYSTLLNRSIDFDIYQAILDPAYPDKLDQALGILVAQMLWDRGEGNGYANHYTDPLPGVAEKTALVQGALGDHQVANVATEVMARSMGASVLTPAVAPDRTNDVEPFFGIPAIESSPHLGSAVVMFDSGAPLPPTTNTAPRDGDDPHEDVRRVPVAYDQIAAFFQPDGGIIDTCGGVPCNAVPGG